MAQRAQSTRPTRFRMGRIVALFVILAGLGISARWFYYYQRDRNTRRLMTEADAAYDREDWTSAADAYGLYLNRDPYNVQALRRYAELLLERGKATPQSIGEATRALRRLLQADEHDPDAMGQLTGIYFAINEVDLAEQMARRWLETAKDDTDATVALFEAFRRQGRIDDSSKLLSDAIERGAGRPEYYPLLIEIHLAELKDPNGAQAWMAQGLAGSPESADVQMAAFTYYRAQNEPDRAEPHLERALEFAPDRQPILLSGAGFYISRDRLDEAKQLLDRAAQIDAQDRRLLMIHGSWAMKQGTRDALLQTAAMLDRHSDPDDGELIALGAELCLRAGAFAEADVFLERLRPIARRDEQAQTWFEVLHGARILLSGSVYEAVPYLERAVRRSPSHLWTMELLADAYTRVGAFDEAAELHRRISLRTPGSAAIELSLARIAWRQGRPAAALDHLDMIDSVRTSDQRLIVELVDIVCRFELLRPDAPDRDAQTVAFVQRLAQAETDTMGEPFAVELLASGYARADAPERAVAFVDRAASEREANPAVLAQAGHALADAGAAAPAHEVATILIRTFPESEAGYVLESRGLAQAGGLEEAERYVDQLEVSDEIKGPAWAVVADVLRTAGSREQATVAFRHAIELLPNDIPTRQGLVRCVTDKAEAERLIVEIKEIEGADGLHWRYEQAAFLTRVDRSEPALREALELVQVCLDARPGWTAALLVRGLAQESLGQLAEAADSYRTAISQQPQLTQGDIAIRLVGILRQLGRLAEADTMVATLADSRPNEPRVLRLQTERYLRHRQLASAVTSAEELLAVNRTDSNWAAFTADLQLRANNPKRAEQIARDGLAEDEQSIALLWSLARALVAQGETAAAETYVRDSAQRLNDANHYLVLAQLLARLDRQDDAVAAVDRALAIAPDNPTVSAAASDFWGAAGDRTKQLSYARKTITLRGEDPNESVVLATLLAEGRSREESDEARAIVSRRLSVDGEDVDALILSARLATTAQPPDFGRAEQYLQTALAVDPRSEPAHKLLAAVQARTGRLNEARNTVEAGLSYAPDNPDLLRTAGELHIHRGEFAAAVAPLRRLIEVGAETPATVLLLAGAYRQTGRIDRALDLLQRRISEERATPAEYTTLAELYETSKNYDRAEAAFLQAIERSGADGLAFQRYVNYLARRSELDRVYALTSQRQTRYPADVQSVAVAGEVLASSAEDPELRTTGLNWLSEIVAQQPDHAADAAFRSGMSSYRRDDLIQAEAMFRKASRLAPMAPRPVNGLAWLYLEDRQRPNDALIIIDRFLAQGGRENAEMLDTHAAILVQLSRYEEAEPLLARCLTMAGQSPTLTAANYRMGLVLCKLGRETEGASYLRKAVLLNDRLSGLLPHETRNAEEMLSR